MNKYFSFLKLLLGWPLSLLSFIFIFKFISSKTNLIFPNLKEINFIILFFGIICFFIYFLLRSYLWKRILKEKGFDIPLKEVCFLWSQAELNRFIPGNIWSFLGRTISFHEKGIPKKSILSFLVLEIQFFLISCLLVSIFCASFIIYNLIPNFPFLNYIVPSLIGLIILISIIYIYVNSFKKFIPISFIRKLLPDFNKEINFNLLLISTVSMIFFGLGSYLSIFAVIFLTPVYIFTFIGLFTFSLLVGYLSIIAPMGLGVREGVITFGLSKFISLNQALFASIFVRIVMIFSEIIFYIFTFFWKTTKNKIILRTQVFAQDHVYEILLGIFVLIYFTYFTTLSFLRYDNFFTGRFDLGNMDQTVWNTMKGNIFQLTDPNGTEIISRLSFHADFILILLTPFYFFWADPKMLLLIQTAVLSLGAIFVFLIAKHFLKNKSISFIFSLAYLLNPSLQHANLYDFHAVTLATTLLLGALYFFIKEKYFFFLVFVILAALTKEQVWVIISLFGFLYIFSNIKKLILKQCQDNLHQNIRKFFLGALLAFLPLILFYYLVAYAIPQARGTSQHFALSYYSEFGESPGAIIKNIFFSPQKTIETVLENGRLNYLNQLFFPVGYLSLLSPLFLIFALPDLGINLLSNNTQLHQIYYQYTAAITPFLFISAILAVKKLRLKFPQIPLRFYAFFLIATTMFSAYSFGPLIGAKNPNISMVTNPLPNREVIERFLSKIPAKYSVASTNNLGSHLSQRQRIFTIPIGIEKADIILFLLNDSFAQPSLLAQKKMASELKRNKDYLEIFTDEDFVVFAKKSIYSQSFLNQE